MTDLATGRCSVTRTARGRWFWAAWWTGEPTASPFRKPDASNGGARTREDAIAEAERVAGRPLTLVDPHWAHAWNRVLRGEAPPPPPRPRPAPARAAAPQRPSAHAILGVEPGATLEEIKRAYRRRVLEAHPDRGGDPEVLRAVVRAYERLSARRDRRR